MPRWPRPPLLVLVLLLMLATPASSAGGSDHGEFEPWGTAGLMAGPEDLDVDRWSDPQRPRLIISAEDRRHRRESGIWEVPLGQDGPGRPRRLFGGDLGFPFHPHGISVTRTEGGAVLLYVVNHRSRREHTVEVFRLDRPREGDPQTLRHELLRSPNDLVATADGHLYVTNEATFLGPWNWIREGAKWASNSSVAHYDGRVWRRAPVYGLHYANGVAASADRLYVAATVDRKVFVYRRDAQTGEVGERLYGEEMDVGSGVDNLLWDESGEVLYTAAHPDGLAFIRHRLWPGSPSPSEVWRLRPKGEPERIFRDDGAMLSGASTALVFRGRLYLGQVFGHGVQVWQQRDPAGSVGGAEPGGSR